MSEGSSLSARESLRIGIYNFHFKFSSAERGERSAQSRSCQLKALGRLSHRCCFRSPYRAGEYPETRDKAKITQVILLDARFMRKLFVFNDNAANHA
jgi:hypothetical protein